MPMPIAIWNPARDVWETPNSPGLFCEHLDVYSETFPTSGMTANGAAYELPTWEPHTDASESSSLLLKTPTSQLAVNGGSQHPDKRKLGGHGPTLADEIEHLLPTPAAHEPGFTLAPVDKHGNPPEHGAQRWYHPETGRLLQKGVSQVIANLLPTPQAHDAVKGKTSAQVAAMRAKGHGVANLNELAENELAPTGESTNPRSDAGNQLWEDVPLPLPNPQDATADTGSAPGSPNG